MDPQFQQFQQMKQSKQRSGSCENIIDIEIDKQEKQNLPNIPRIHNTQCRLIKLGVCAMNKKATSFSMTQILDRLKYFSQGEIEVQIFPENVILNAPVTDWPKVDVLYAFFSKGFPLLKAQEYQRLVKPFVLNDLYKQEWLWDRKKIYEELDKINVPVPRHYFVIRDPQDSVIERYKQMSCTPPTRQIRQKSDADEVTTKEKINTKQVENFQLESFNSKNKLEVEGENDVDNVIKKLNEENQQKNSSTAYSFEEQAELKQELSIQQEEKEKQIPSKLFREELTIQKVDSNRSSGKTLNYSSTVKINSSQQSLLESKRTSISPMQSMLQATQVQSQGLCNKVSNNETSMNDLEEYDDYILVNDKKLFKPFVEKPFDAEDHNIYIYYHSNDGGGCKKLFRKVGNQSSRFEKNIQEIRQKGNYIYEEFRPTGGFDIKVYTVGADYAHAEARKSPTLDGKVLRTENGKETRYPVMLNNEEKKIASRIVFWFGQRICGFDLLRSNGKSYVCDVNGMSFVKGNENYFQDCAVLFRQMILKEFCPERLIQTAQLQIQLLLNSQQPTLSQQEIMDMPQANTRQGEQLKSIVAVFRHGDRTPKQKMKQKTSDPRFLQFFSDQKDPTKEIKLKSAKSLEKVLQIANEIVEELHEKLSTYTLEKTPLSSNHAHHQCHHDKQQYEDHCNLQDDLEKFQQLQSVLSMRGHFSGINRKIQLKPINFSGAKVTEAQFIVKWGGELTHSGEQLTEQLGTQFRQFYPECILRLHNTYKHDLKIYSSDEGRCQKTAAAFCKGFLGLTGPLTPIIVSLVRKDELVQQWLDMQHGFDHSKMNEVHAKIDLLLHTPGLLFDSFQKLLGIDFLSPFSIKIIKSIKEPLVMMKNLFDDITFLTQKIQEAVKLQKHTYYISLQDLKPPSKSLTSLNDLDKAFVCGEETSVLVYKRWYKLQQDFYIKKEDKYNISKIPSIYDSICYDIVHNSKYFQPWSNIVQRIHKNCKKLHKFVNHYEYGIKPECKLKIGFKIVSPLLQKLHLDMRYWSMHKNEMSRSESQTNLNTPKYAVQQQLEDLEKESHHRTRIYFTSSSHMHSLFSVIRQGLRTLLTPESLLKLTHIKYLGYLSSFIFKTYEDQQKDKSDPNRFRLEITLSPGCILQESNQQENQRKCSSGERINNQFKHFLDNVPVEIKEVDEFVANLQEDDLENYKKPQYFSSIDRMSVPTDDSFRVMSPQPCLCKKLVNSITDQGSEQQQCYNVHHNHIVNVEHEIILTQNLTLEQLDEAMIKMFSQNDTILKLQNDINDQKNNYQFGSDFLNYNN